MLKSRNNFFDMKTLLLHSKNFSDRFTSLFDHNVSISLPKEEGIDTFIHDELSEIFEEKQEVDLIAMPINFSNEFYFELMGLRIAAHIRLTPEWNHVTTPIVFLCQETSGELYQINELGSILFTNNTYLCNHIDPTLITEYLNRVVSKPRDKFLFDKLRVPAPSNIDSDHSLANIWGAYRLDEVAGTQVLKNKKDKFHLIYFKWLQKKYPSEGLRSKKIVEDEKNYRREIQGLKVVGKIDLDKFKKK